MDESVVAQEAAKIVLEKQGNQLLSDLIKVGIPSIVAIISGVVTYKVSKSNSEANVKLAEMSKQYDEKIALLNIDHDKLKKNSERRHELLTELIRDVSEIIDSNYKYLNALAVKINGGNVSDEVSDILKNRLVESFNKSSDVTNELLYKSVSYSHLLDEEELAVKLNDLGSFITEMITTLGTGDKEKVALEHVVFHKKKLQSHRNEIFKVMKEVFRI